MLPASINTFILVIADVLYHAAEFKNIIPEPFKPAPVTDYSQPMPNYLDPAYQQAGY